ncbi:MAG: type IV pilus twitching motility protein PilT [Elusimicrobiota bacterium]|nr:type IV pilus twitching motility protein PilT [Elusimicrobiota bacterium]MDH5661444.1 type IV pilus twitching motility protein PilT [Elusimicrobiota bacterium]
MVSIDELLQLMMEKGASDLHLTVDVPPTLRIDGELVATEYEKLQEEQCQRLIYSLLTDKQKERFESTNELDLSFGIKNVGRVRMNVFRQRGVVGASLRAIPNYFMTFEELGLPPVVFDVVKLPVGLVLVTGPTGCGKTTTLASMMNYINEHRSGHIVTVEDPIEYVHPHKSCVVNQREVGSDTSSFGAALKHVFRQDPDFILVGEMRDLETISSALTIAETGHLVFATLHTTDATQSVNRIVDVFPPYQQPQIRSQLSFVLQAVFCQRLLPRASGKGRCLAVEVLRATPAIRNMIRENKTEQIPSAMQAGGKFGMQTMNWSLYGLYTRRQITYAQALAESPDADDLKRICKKEEGVVPQMNIKR